MDTRHMFELQYEQPVFVRAVPPGLTHLNLAGGKYKQGDEIPWRTKNISEETIRKLMRAKWLYHNSNMASEAYSGDGLDRMSLDEMKQIVDSINEKVKKHTKNDFEFKNKKCKKSGSRMKQMGLIRMWRSLYGHMEVED